MTWQQLVNFLTFEIRKNHQIANEPALVWLFDDVEYKTGEYEVSDIDPAYMYKEVGADNRLSMNIKE